MAEAAAGTRAPAAASPMEELDQRRVLVIFGALMLGMLLAALDQRLWPQRCRRSWAISAG